MLKRHLTSFLTSVFLIFFISAFGQQPALVSSPLLSTAAEPSLVAKAEANDSSAISNVLLASNVEADLAWKDWAVVENFAFGKDRGALTMITDLNALHPYFRDKIKELIKNCKAQGIELAIVESFRTHAKQNEYKSMGKGYTNSSAGRSKHQYGLAVDVVPVVNRKAVWENRALWLKVGVTGEKLGLRWGGRWKKPYDPAHFEWTGGLTSVHLAAGTLPAIPQESYPCIEEDMIKLRAYWKEWESLQASLLAK